ncbi:MAG: hypothetical protein JNK67_16800 [Alphaproteobacteria bacterium]|nr:hypothetical protein [Alphaproteobacteria bacterium]
MAADAAAGALHALASGMLQRAADGRAVALMMRRDAEKRLRDLALGRTVVAFEAHRLAESQAAARISAALSRQSDAQASALCLRAREAAQWSLAALAAACRADPARGNAALDPRCSRAALGDARAAAAKAGQLASVATDRVSPGGLESDLAGALEAVPGQESDAEPAPSAAGEPGIVAVAARDGADR